MANAARHRSRRRLSFVDIATVPIALVGGLTTRLQQLVADDATDREPTVEPKHARTKPDSDSEPQQPLSALYRVKAGDTVSEIAIVHGVSTADVLARNGLSWKSPIYPGQILWLGDSVLDQADDAAVGAAVVRATRREN